MEWLSVLRIISPLTPPTVQEAWRGEEARKEDRMPPYEPLVDY